MQSLLMQSDHPNRLSRLQPAHHHAQKQQSAPGDLVHEALARDAQGCSCSGLTLVDAPLLIADGGGGVGQHASRIGRPDQGCRLNVLVMLGAGRTLRCVS